MALYLPLPWLSPSLHLSQPLVNFSVSILPQRMGSGDVNRPSLAHGPDTPVSDGAGVNFVSRPTLPVRKLSFCQMSMIQAGRVIRRRQGKICWWSPPKRVSIRLLGIYSPQTKMVKRTKKRYAGYRCCKVSISIDANWKDVVVLLGSSFPRGLGASCVLFPFARAGYPHSEILNVAPRFFHL